MPAFCYLRHAGDAVPAKILEEMGKALCPSDPGAPGALRQTDAPSGTLLYWSAPHVLLDIHRSPCGGMAFVSGEAFGPDSPRRFTAAEAFSDPGPLHSASGLFSWMRIFCDGSLEAGADPFGLYPLYYLNSGKSLAIATSTSVLRAHPEYNRKIDLVGVFRHLIENGCAGERTLEEGGKRITSGKVLSFAPNTPSAHLKCHALNWLSDNTKITGERDAVELSVNMSEQAFLRQIQGRLDHMLMSGGLDSRQLAALAQKHKFRPHCHTFGIPTDMESFLARRTARAIRAKWSSVPDHFDNAALLARAELKMLSLSGGFSTVTLRGCESVAKQGATRLLSGLMLDNMYSPMLRTPCSHEVGTFDYCMEIWINRFGVPIQTLRTLARKGPAREALEDALAEIQHQWRAYPGDMTDRIWRTIVEHRMRPHLGGHLWKSLFYGWLMLPALDVPFVQATRRISGEILKGRVLQRQTVAKLSPALARIPLDTISDTPQSILPGRWNSLQHRIYLNNLRKKGLHISETHRFRNIMTMAHPAWQEIRREAEPGRSALETIMDAKVLQGYPPDVGHVEIANASPLAGHGGYRLMLGLMLWMEINGKASASFDRHGIRL